MNKLNKKERKKVEWCLVFTFVFREKVVIMNNLLQSPALFGFPLM